MKLNPFLTKGYISPDYFCDREAETNKLLSAIRNQRNLTLISLRRMGKTGLIHHAFHNLKEENKEFVTIYTDIYSTESLSSFVTVFGNSVIKQLKSPVEKVISQISSVFKSIRPSITIDPMSGVPVIDFNIQNEKDASISIENIFRLINEEKSPKVIAIDEFQQITNYSEKNTEALLRALVQNTPETSYIFSGSSKNIIMSMFSDYKRPFYQSGELMELSSIDSEKYITFIQEKFSINESEISNETASYLINLCKCHTFYVQFLCNRLYSAVTGNITIDDINLILSDILKENEPLYFSFRDLLTEQQFKVLSAIGKEGIVKFPNSIDFTKTYRLGPQSSVSSALKSLISKDLIYQDSAGFHVYDQFLSLWLQRTF